MMLKLLFLLIAQIGSAWAICSADYPNLSIKPSTPSADFIILSSNQLVEHRPTGLIWDRCPLGQNWNGTSCIGTADQLSWQDALKAAENARQTHYLGYNDWRVANIKELSSIVESCGHTAAINQSIFPLTVNYDANNDPLPLPFWSSTSIAQAGNKNIWTVDFINAWIYPQYLGANSAPVKQYVRLVRGGNGFDRLAPITATLDIDGDMQISALTDGLLILRYLAGYNDADLIQGAVNQNCSRCTATEIKIYLAGLISADRLDADGDGQTQATTDGLLILRYMEGQQGNALTEGAVGAQCTRCDANSIISYLNSL